MFFFGTSGSNSVVVFHSYTRGGLFLVLIFIATRATDRPTISLFTYGRASPSHFSSGQLDARAFPLSVAIFFTSDFYATTDRPRYHIFDWQPIVFRLDSLTPLSPLFIQLLMVYKCWRGIKMFWRYCVRVILFLHFVWALNDQENELIFWIFKI